MRHFKHWIYASFVLLTLLSIPQSYAQPHAHGARTHTHGLPAQGIGHRHNKGLPGRRAANTQTKKVRSKSRYIRDQKGCLHLNSVPVSNESITWTGKCVNGFAHGDGYRQWYRNGRKNGGMRFFLKRGLTPRQIEQGATGIVPARTKKKPKAVVKSNTNRYAAKKAKSRRILNDFSLPRKRCYWPDVPVFKTRSQVANFKQYKAKPYIRCLNDSLDDDYDDLRGLVRDLGGTWRKKGSQVHYKVPNYCDCEQEVSRWFKKIGTRLERRERKRNKFIRLVNKRINRDEGAIVYQEANPNWKKRKKRPLGNGPKRIIVPSSPSYTTPGYY